MKPTPEQLREWTQSACMDTGSRGEACHAAARLAYAAGADAELEACCEWMIGVPDFYTGAEIDLRAARRPKPPSLKPPSLKQQALDEMELLESHGVHATCLGTLRRALESLPDD